jgi:ligand-binding sensor domain-containing protein
MVRSQVLAVFWLLLMPAMAQYPHIHKMRVSIPLAEPVFNKCIQDSRGFIWLGSDNALYRFDGISYKSFHPSADSVEFNITALYEDTSSILWIGCRDGKIYRMAGEEVSLFSPEEGTAGLAVSDILTDNEGNLWWSTTGEGIYYYKDGRVYNINHDDGLNDDYVYDLECDREGMIWAGTDGGVAICSVKQGQKTVHSLGHEISLPDQIVRVIKEDREGRLWFGFQDGGVAMLLPDRSRISTLNKEADWLYGPVQDIVVLGDLTWVATASGDLLEIQPGKSSGNMTAVRAGQDKFGKINVLLEDREGNVWIAANSGFYRTTGIRLKFLEQVSDMTLDNIHAIRNDQNDQDLLWFSSDKGLFRMNTRDGSTKRFLENFRLPNLKVMCIYQDEQGYIWAGTFNYGVFRIYPESGSWIQVTEDQGLVNNNVLSISGHDDTLWMATLGGASKLILKGNAGSETFTIETHNREKGLVNNFIYSIFEDTHDQIWFATDGDGISVLTKTGWVNYNEQQGLADDVIYSISGDKNGDIWISSASNGIFKLSGDKFTRYGIEDGLTSVNITGIATVEDEVVIIQDNGLDILHIPTGRITHYGEELGLTGISPDLNVICRDQSGYIWIGTRKGIIRYRPGSGAASNGPQTVLEEMLVFLDPREMEDDLVLGSGKNHISFRYSGLWYSNPEKVIYQVFLEGYDLGWKDTYDRLATYSSLPPGDYTFKVRTSLNQSFRNSLVVSYHFRIKGPFWKSFWFISLLIIFIATITYLVIRYREGRLRRIEQQKKEKVEFEFQVLKNQVNPHFLFNSFSTLISLIEDQPEQAVQYTEKLSDFFRTILQFKDQEVIGIQEELSLIDSYFFLLKKRFGANLNLDVAIGEKTKKSFIPPMTLQILIENAVKHNIISKEKPLFIRIYEDEGRIVVENNLQPKLTAEVSTGIGLENIRKRYRLITKEEPLIEKMENVFRVKLPVI